MKDSTAISNLKDLVNLYGNFKTDIEIAELLDISLDKIQSVKDTEKNKTQQEIRKDILKI